MSRLTEPRREDLDDESREIYDDIVRTRGHVAAPFAILLRLPALARSAADLGGSLRFRGSLPEDVRELATLATAAGRHSRYEWEYHVPLARKAGIDERTVSAIARSDLKAIPLQYSEVCAFVFELCQKDSVDAATYGAALKRLGETGLVELSALVGYYSMLACVLNAFDAQADGMLASQ